MTTKPQLRTLNTLFFAAVAVAASLVAGAAGPADDATAIEGSWKPVQAELGGQAMPEAIVKTISLRLDHGRYYVTVAGSPDNGTYTLDAATQPSGMTVTGTDGPNKGKTFPCIYELKGDTLRVCYDLSGAKRPAEFKTNLGTQLYLVTYKRARSAG